MTIRDSLPETSPLPGNIREEQRHKTLRFVLNRDHPADAEPGTTQPDSEGTVGSEPQSY